MWFYKTKVFSVLTNLVNFDAVFRYFSVFLCGFAVFRPPLLPLNFEWSLEGFWKILFFRVFKNLLPLPPKVEILKEVHLSKKKKKFH